MLRFIEKSFLKITQVVGLLFAIIVLVTAITIGYNKINIKVDKVEVPRISRIQFLMIIHIYAKISFILKYLEHPL
jgi:nicotinamide riboside transporter PnuC